jgi:hypothetical protein
VGIGGRWKRSCDSPARMKVLELYSGIGGMHFAFKGVYDVIADTYINT